MRAYPKPEGDLFPTFAALLLAAVGFAGAVSTSWAQARTRPPANAPLLVPLVYVLVAAAVDLPAVPRSDSDRSRLHAHRSAADQRQEPLAQLPRVRHPFRIAAASSRRARDRLAASARSASARSRAGRGDRRFCSRSVPEIRTGGRLDRRGRALLISLLAHARVRRASRAGTIRDARRAVSRDGRGMRRRGPRTAAPPRRCVRSRTRRVRRRRGDRRAHHYQRNGGGYALRPTACPCVHGRAGAARLSFSRNAARTWHGPR